MGKHPQIAFILLCANYGEVVIMLGGGNLIPISITLCSVKHQCHLFLGDMTSPINTVKETGRMGEFLLHNAPYIIYNQWSEYNISAIIYM